MKTIHKYVLALDTEQIVEMPKFAKILHVDNQNDKVVFWAQVDTDAPRERRRFAIHGTGHPLPDDPGDYLGTVLIESGFLVTHLYETT